MKNSVPDWGLKGVKGGGEKWGLKEEERGGGKVEVSGGTGEKSQKYGLSGPLFTRMKRASFHCFENPRSKLVGKHLKNV